MHKWFMVGHTNSVRRRYIACTNFPIAMLGASYHQHQHRPTEPEAPVVGKLKIVGLVAACSRWHRRACARAPAWLQEVACSCHGAGCIRVACSGPWRSPSTGRCLYEDVRSTLDRNWPMVRGGCDYETSALMSQSRSHQSCDGTVPTYRLEAIPSVACVPSLC